MDYRIIVSTSTQPLVNLALEEYLFRQLPPEQTLLLIYRNQAAVVIGRNQNPWAECTPASLAHTGVAFARRISGGGAVFHGPGNLNYCFMMPRAEYEPTRYLGWIVAALQRWQIPAQLSPRHDIRVHDAKVSGTAFLLTGARALQHGTLLIEADLTLLRQALRPAIAAQQLQTHAVASVRSAVTNLRSYAPQLSLTAAEKMLVEMMQSRYGDEITVEFFTDAMLRCDPLWQDYVAKQHDWQWRFARTPAFVQQFVLMLQGQGAMSIEITVREACIDAITAAAEAPTQQQQLLQILQQRWLSQPYDCERLGAELHALTNSVCLRREACDANRVG